MFPLMFKLWLNGKSHTRMDNGLSWGLAPPVGIWNDCKRNAKFQKMIMRTDKLANFFKASKIWEVILLKSTSLLLVFFGNL